MKKLIILLIFALLSFSVYVSAQDIGSKDIEVKLVKVKGAITANDVGEFDIIVTNNMLKDIDFFIAKNFYSEKWRATADPYLLSVESGFTKTTRLNIAPVKFLIPGNYKIVVNIESRDKSYVKEIPLDVEVIPFGEDNIETELIVNNEIDPRLGSPARVSLENLYNYDIDDVELSFKSDLFSFDRDFDLKANEKRVETFQLDFGDDVELGDYNFNVVVKVGNSVLGTATEKVILAPFSEITEKIFRSNKFNKKIIISKENTGTKESIEEVKLELSSIERFVARFNVNPDSIEKVDGKYIAVWGFSLEPKDRKDIVVTLPYGTYLLILFVIALLIYIIFYITRTKVVLVKKIIDVTKDKEGIRGVKIILHLKNKGNKSIEKIRIIDYMPRLIAASGKDFGSMKPTKVQKTIDGRMRLVWDFDGLRRGEERIVSYLARSNLSIIGRLLLPEAVVEFQVGKKIYHNRSNKLTLLTRPSKKERMS